MAKKRARKASGGGRGRPGKGVGNKQPMNLARLVLWLTRSRQGLAVEDIQARLGVSERTYRKYRKTLFDLFEPWQEAGETILEEVADERGRKYLRVREPERVNGEVIEFLTRFSAFLMAREVLSALGEGELAPHLEAIVGALGADGRRQFPQTFSRLARDVDRTFVYLPDAPKSYAGQEETLRTIVQGVVFHRLLRFRYDPANAEPREHEVEPLSLVLFRGGLHLLVRYPGKTRVYNFAVDRMREATLLDRYFAYPSRDEYDPREHQRGAFGIYVDPRATEPLEVVLEFAPVKWLQYYVREREWQASQRLEDLPDGRLRLSFEVTTLVEVVPWVLQFGDEVEVVGPEALREAVTRARAAAPAGTSGEERPRRGSSRSGRTTGGKKKKKKGPR